MNVPRTPLTVVHGGTKRRRYTRRTKATAIIAAELSTVAAAAEQTGIPRKTLAYWMERPEFAALRQKTREEQAEGFAVLVVLAMDRIEALLPTMEARDVITLMGVATDKSQLLSGQATSRSETRELLESFDDGEIEGVQAWLRERARERLARPT